VIGLHYDITAEAYHADPAPQPSLSSSIAKVMLDQSPRHAFALHPRLTEQPEADKSSRDMELGSAVHAAILGKGQPVHVIDADTYQTKAAKEAREYAYANGMIPLLRDDHARMAAIATAFNDQIMVEVMSQTVLLGWKGPLGFQKELVGDYSQAKAKKLLEVKDFRRLVANLSNEMEAYLMREEAAQGEA
jgi:hypothetical protein